MPNQISISLNGEIVQVRDGATLADAIAADGERKVAAARNGEFVPRAAHAQTQLCEGDRIDLVKPIGGG